MLSGSLAAALETTVLVRCSQQPAGGKISVCHVVSGDLWAGAEAQVAALLRALSGQQMFHLFAILLNEGRLAEEVRKCGVQVKVIPEGQTSFAGILREATEFLRARGIRILHSHRYKENLLAVLLAWRCHVPSLVRTEHGAPEPSKGLKVLKQYVVRQADRLAARYATDSVISVSAEMQRRLARTVSRERIALIPNGLDTIAVGSPLSPCDAKRRLNVPGTSPVLGYAGRLAPIKRLDIFIAAAKEIAGRIPEARFVIAGGGSERSPLEQIVTAAGLQDRVLFLGHRNDIYDVLRAFDVFILSSDHEGLPIVLLEALHLGIPVVARRVGGIPEVVQNGVSGLLVDSADPKAFAEAAMQILQDSSLRDRLTIAGALRVAQYFSAERTASDTADLYLQLGNRE